MQGLPIVPQPPIDGLSLTPNVIGWVWIVSMKQLKLFCNLGDNTLYASEHTRTTHHKHNKKKSNILPP